MRNVSVLKTDLEEGTIQMTSNISYLGEKFFKEFTKMSEKPLDKQHYKLVNIKFMRVSWLTSDED